MAIRLDKWLSEMTKGSRSEVKQWIKQGRVTVNDRVVCRPETKVNAEQDAVTLDGETVVYRQYVYYMLNKPAGVVSATEDRGHKTVVELLPDAARDDIFPVGRLDIDTEGLLLLTNDGAMAHALLSPKKHVDKTYLVHLDEALTIQEIKCLQEGMDIGDETPTLPAKVEVVKGTGSPDRECVYITIHEGRYHQIKRMFGKLGKPVRYLKRLTMGGLCLDESLKEGQYRELTQEEIASLRSGRSAWDGRKEYTGKG